MQINIKKWLNENKNNIKVKKKMKRRDWPNIKAEIRRR
jgi:hypothetical protein